MQTLISIQRCMVITKNLEQSMQRDICPLLPLMSCRIANVHLSK